VLVNLSDGLAGAALFALGSAHREPDTAASMASTY
jgi:hypothetical protein